MTKLNQRIPTFVQTIHVENVPVTSVAGEIDMSNTDEIRDEVQAQLAAKPDVLVLDFSAVGFMGSAGIHLLVDSQLEADENGIRLAVVLPDDSFAHRVLMLAGVTHMFDRHTDRNSALHAR